MDELRRLGNKVARGQLDGPPLEIGANANVLAFDPATGTLEAASEVSEDSAAVI